MACISPNKFPVRLEKNPYFASKENFSTSYASGRFGTCFAQRSSLWRSRNMGREAVEVAQELVWAQKDEDRVKFILENQASRLVKEDLMQVMGELQRQDEWQLLLQIFDFLKREVWYKPEEAVYRDVIQCLGRNHRQDLSLQFFREMETEGLCYSDKTYTAMIGAFCRDNMHQEGIAMLREMQAAGIHPYDLTFALLISACEAAMAEEEATALREERLQVCGTEEGMPIKEILQIRGRMRASP